MSNSFSAGPLGLNPWAVASCLFPLVIVLRIPLVQQSWKHGRQAHDVCRVLLVLTMGWTLVQQRLQATEVHAFAPLSDSLNHKLYSEASQLRAMSSTCLGSATSTAGKSACSFRLRSLLWSV